MGPAQRKAHNFREWTSEAAQGKLPSSKADMVLLVSHNTRAKGQTPWSWWARIATMGRLGRARCFIPLSTCAWMVTTQRDHASKGSVQIQSAHLPVVRRHLRGLLWVARVV